MSDLADQKREVKHACRKDIPGQYDGILDHKRNGDAAVFQPFAQFFQVVGVAEQESFVLINGLESFLGCLLGEETLVLLKSTLRLELLC